MRAGLPAGRRAGLELGHASQASIPLASRLSNHHAECCCCLPADDGDFFQELRGMLGMGGPDENDSLEGGQGGGEGGGGRKKRGKQVRCGHAPAVKGLDDLPSHSIPLSCGHAGMQACSCSTIRQRWSLTISSHQPPTTGCACLASVAVAAQAAGRPQVADRKTRRAAGGAGAALWRCLQC